MALHAPDGRSPGETVLPGRAASTISARLRPACQVRRRCTTGQDGLAWAIKRGACQAAGMTGDGPVARGLRDVRAAETGEGELIEVTFSPAEPQLTPGAARVVL